MRLLILAYLEQWQVNSRMPIIFRPFSIATNKRIIQKTPDKGKNPVSGFSGNNSGVSQLIHKWAQQNKAHGQRSNVRFDGQCLYSYAAQIGRFYPVESKAKHRIVVLSRKKYSPTTSAHQSAAWSATTHYCQITTDNWTSGLPIDWQKAKKILLKEHLAQLKAECEALITKRSVEQHLSYIKHVATETLAFYNQCFKPSEFPKRSPFTPAALRILAGVGITTETRRIRYLELHFEPKLPQKLAQQVKRDEKLKANKKSWLERETIRREREAIEDAQRLELWKQGAEFCSSSTFYRFPIALRIRGEDIETSRGARVPLQAALAFYDRLKSPTEPIEGFQIGAFTVRDVYGANGTQIVRIGCHEIPMTEIERIKAEL